ncbi:hypothetical protein B9Z55_007565 [Caenorhabditis nigoni]|uniref:DUF281 domain-containing protein n=1 Tax=Caenorhabditis nigoni TaxID=1611254 RepID=A0A2G5VAH3_9PELO|nr:hypothetical protein B9Z55_007565 [Caenorhabditis nigoni]
MIFQLFIFSIFFVPQLKACVATIPPEEVYITTTEAISPTDEPVEETTEATTEMTTEVTTPAGAGCTMCDIDQIAPKTMPDNTVFYTEERDPVDGCQTTYTVCRRDDDRYCQDVIMTAINADGSHSVTDDTTFSAVATTFTCGDDSLYSWNGM